MGCGSSTSGSPPESVQHAPREPQPQHRQHQSQQQPQSPQQQQQPPTQQQQQKPQPERAEQTEIQVKKVKLDKKVLEKYLNLEKQAHAFESKNVIKGLKVKQEQLVDLEQTCKQLEEHYQLCVKQTEKELGDVEKLKDPNVKNFLQQQQNFDATFTKEQEEYLEALNKQEIAKRELDGVTKQKEQLTKEIKALQGDVDKINKIYKEQDELLASIFDGQYGSELEYNLEMELDVLQDRRTRIGIAKYKWTNARVLLQHAVNQLAYAVKKLEELKGVKPDQRYTMATEARNNLVAANQNVTSAQKYLHTIQFPYCKPDEMETLARATNNIYTDMQSEERLSHAMNCYGTTHKRAAALLQWFDNVIKNTIGVDLEKALAAANEKETQLRAERLRLIKEKIVAAGGKGDLNVANEMELGDENDSQLQTMAVDANNKTVAAPAANQQQNQETGESGSGEEGGPTPLSLNELAPPPNNDDIFADIAELKDKHERELKEFQKAQEVNKTRMESGLEEKLRARRSRRQRMEAQEQQQEQ